jgi:transcriptional regulator with XRE-family HTH domain
MDLQTYYKLAKINDRHIAERSGLTLPTIWRVRKGLHIPKAVTAKRISDATDGAVTVMELLYPGNAKN